MLPADWRARRAALLKQWRTHSSSDRSGTKSAPAKPFGGRAPSDFLMKVHQLRDSLQLMEASAVCELWHLEAALVLVSKGFEQLQQLDGLYRKDLKSWSDNARVQTLLFKALDAVTNAETVKRARISSGQPKLEAQHISADAVACQANEFWAEADGLNVSPGGPRDRVAALAKIQAHEAQRMLEIKAASLKASTQKRSLASVASGLRCWHQFAVTVLQYRPEETLPPKCARDIVYFVAIFQNPGTARNYVSYVRWACVLHRLDCAWFDPEVQMVLRGLDKHYIESLPGQLSDKPLLTEDMVARLVTLCSERPGFEDLGDLFLVAWQFLLRVPSEGIPLQYGDRSELHILPDGRRSALTVDAQFCAHLRLRHRKHRPQGSLLSRPCCCNGERSVLCVGHRLGERSKACSSGDSVVTRSRHDCLKLFHNSLNLLGVLGPERYTWKAFRAGKARMEEPSGAQLRL